MLFRQSPLAALLVDISPPRFKHVLFADAGVAASDAIVRMAMRAVKTLLALDDTLAGQQKRGWL